MPTTSPSGAIPAAVQAWRMVASAAARSTATAGKSGVLPAFQATRCLVSAHLVAAGGTYALARGRLRRILRGDR
jgi:hypothetical protein